MTLALGLRRVHKLEEERVIRMLPGQLAPADLDRAARTVPAYLAVLEQNVFTRVALEQLWICVVKQRLLAHRAPPAGVGLGRIRHQRIEGARRLRLDFGGVVNLAQVDGAETAFGGNQQW